MNKLLLMALVAIGFLVSARADIRVVVSIRNQSAWLVDGNRILMTSAVSTAKGECTRRLDTSKSV